MNAQEYEDYRKTDAWKSIRSLCMKLCGYRCWVCGCTAWRRPVDAHHLTYQRVGHEWPDDLVALCSTHHELIHNQPEGYGIDVENRLRRECTEDHWDDP